MKIGMISEYVVKRETDLGYMINDEDGDFFLHHNECNGHKYQTGEKIAAFLFYDKKKRVAATTFVPKVTIDKPGICEVISVTEIGAFVNIGINRDILLSRDDLEKGCWPEAGDKVCCRLHHTGSQLLIKLLTKQEILELRTEDLVLDNKYKAYVYRITEKGINVFTENFNVIYIFYKNLRKQYRLGEEVEVKVINKNDDDYTGTLIAQKEMMINDDANVILAYLKAHHGVMPYTSKSDSEMIYKVFKMSKLAFKRALGHLYKQRLVVLEEDKTSLTEL